MASTLGVLDVLSQLRGESERATAALTAQQEAIRSLLQRCIEAEAESGRTDSVREALQHQKKQLDQERLTAETRLQDAECRLRRLRKQQTKREQAAVRKREANAAAADEAVASSKKFRADAYESVRQIGELRARLQDKKRELDSIRGEKHEIDEELNSKKATRDKVKAELESQAEVVASAYSKVEHADRENKASLARAKLVEGEIDETRQAQEEMQEMAVGLQRRNAILRNELRHLKRQVEGDSTGRQHRDMFPPDPHDETRTNSDNGMPLRVGAGRPPSSATSPRVAVTPWKGSGGGAGGSDSGHFYHHSSVPRQEEGRTAAQLQLEAGPRQQHQQYRRNTSTTSSSSNNNNNNNNNTRSNVRAPFATAATVMAMPELRLSSPHPGGRAADHHGKTSAPRDLSSSSSNGGGGHGSGGGKKHGKGFSTTSPFSVDSDESDTFEYHC